MWPKYILPYIRQIPYHPGQRPCVTKVDKSKYPYGYRIKAVNPKINTPYDAAKMRNNSLDGNITSYTQYVQELKEANNRLFYANELKRTSL